MSDSVFSMILKNPKNCSILEKSIKTKTSNEDEYKWVVYQTIGHLIENPKRLKEIGDEIKKGKIGWKNPIYNSIESKMNEFDDYLVKPFEVVEGISECSKCHSRKTWSVQKQTRSSDEPMTTFTHCVDCGNKWTYSG